MTDEELVQAFESATLATDQFTHAAHVRVAWWYLTRYPLGEAMTRFTVALKAFAAAHAVPGLFHETITVAYLLLIAERLEGSRGLTWEGFAQTHLDLLARRPSILARYYSDQTLTSERARRAFVMPDRLLTHVPEQPACGVPDE